MNKKWRKHEKTKLDLFFQKNWNKPSLILFQCFMHCSFISITQITFIALLFACPTTQKLLNWLRNEENIGKCWMIGSCLMICNFTLIQQQSKEKTYIETINYIINMRRKHKNTQVVGNETMSNNTSLQNQWDHPIFPSMHLGSGLFLIVWLH